MVIAIWKVYVILLIVRDVILVVKRFTLRRTDTTLSTSPVEVNSVEKFRPKNDIARPSVNIRTHHLGPRPRKSF